MMKQAVRGLLKRACAHLGLTSKQLRVIEDHSKSLADTIVNQALAFSVMCSMLEHPDDRNTITAWLEGYAKGPRLTKLLSYPRPHEDVRYISLFYMIQQLYRADAENFFDIPAHADEPVEEEVSTATPEQIKEARAALIVQAFGMEEKKASKPKVKSNIPWDDDQNKAFADIRKWLDVPGSYIYRLFGYAGTGKTTMAIHVAQMVMEKGGAVCFAAFGGKAAAVMRSKGCTDASTIHSLIYRPQKDPITGKITGKSINRDSPLASAKLLIVDEVSMVNEEMAMDLLSFGVKILVLGDPKQIKPIEGQGYFVQARPDTMLTKVHRNAKDSPIIYLATRARKGKIIKPGRYGDSIVLAPGRQLPDKYIERADMILCGTNRTRTHFNRQARILNGRFDKDTQFPVKGDQLVCLKNNKDVQLFNGTIWTCSKPEFKTIKAMKDPKRPQAGEYDTNLQGLYFKVRSHDLVDADGNPLVVNTKCSAHWFDPNIPEPHWKDVQTCDNWTFGYCLTGHKGQGSQWDHTAVVDESWIFEDQQEEHLYTNITRAAESMVLQLTR